MGASEFNTSSKQIIGMDIRRTSARRPYRDDLATCSVNDLHQQADAQGFIRLYGLPTKIAAARSRRVKLSGMEAKR